MSRNNHETFFSVVDTFVISYFCQPYETKNNLAPGQMQTYLKHLLLACCILYSCAFTPQKKATVEEWASRQQTVLSLSKAILKGARHLMNELLISSAWFKNMEVSIYAGEASVLHATINDFTLRELETKTLFAYWKIIRYSRRNLQYTNTVTVDENKTRAQQADYTSTTADSIFISVAESSAKLTLPQKQDLNQIKIIYWRNRRKNDLVAEVNLTKGMQGGYTISYPGPQTLRNVKNDTLPVDTTAFKLSW